MISDIARQVLDIIPDNHHWTRDAWSRGHRHCVVDATHMLPLSDSQRAKFYNAFYDTALAQYPDLGDLEELQYKVTQPHQKVIEVNDHPLTRYTWIRTILEKLAARED